MATISPLNGNTYLFDDPDHKEHIGSRFQIPHVVLKDLGEDYTDIQYSYFDGKLIKVFEAYSTHVPGMRYQMLVHTKDGCYRVGSNERMPTPEEFGYDHYKIE